MNISKERLFKTIDENKLIEIKHVFLPYLGKTKFTNHQSTFEITVDNAIVESNLKVVNSHRKDNNDIRFDIENAVAKINFHTMKIEGSFQKVWIGGEIETFNFDYDIISISGKEMSPPALFIEITAELGN